MGKRLQSSEIVGTSARGLRGWPKATDVQYVPLYCSPSLLGHLLCGCGSPMAFGYLGLSSAEVVILPRSGRICFLLEAALSLQGKADPPPSAKDDNFDLDAEKDQFVDVAKELKTGHTNIASHPPTFHLTALRTVSNDVQRF